MYKRRHDSFSYGWWKYDSLPHLTTSKMLSLTVGTMELPSLLLVHCTHRLGTFVFSSDGSSQAEAGSCPKWLPNDLPLFATPNYEPQRACCYSTNPIPDFFSYHKSSCIGRSDRFVKKVSMIMYNQNLLPPSSPTFLLQMGPNFQAQNISSLFCYIRETFQREIPKTWLLQNAW